MFYRFCCFTLLALAAAAQTAPPPISPAPAPAKPLSPAAQLAKLDQQRSDQLQAIAGLDEPGSQIRAYQAFLQRFPGAPETADVYNDIIQAAAALNNDALILDYNEKLQALDPTDLAQRIKTLNLLLLETSPAQRARAQTEAARFAQLVEAKAAEPLPDDMGAVRWRLNLERLRALASLFQGTAAQAVQQYPPAAAFFTASLAHDQTEEAAEHLAQVLLAENDKPGALDAFALALALPGDSIAGRAQLRAQAGALFRDLHQGSEAGFGDLVLQKFDAVAARDAAQQAALHPAANADATRAGDFALTTLDGKVHKLSDYPGKIVVLDFWATWCAPCLAQHPLIVDLRRKFQNNHDVIFVAVNEDEDRAKVAPFLGAHAWADDTWLDAGLGGFLGVDSLPTTLILDPQGALVYRREGLVPATYEEEIEAALRRLSPTAIPNS